MYETSMRRVDFSSLTVGQKEIAEKPPDAKLLVIAGPGTGKTHVLIARLARLISTHGVRPGGELLILSFSRAAVGVIRSRAREAGGDLAYVRAQTFDSFGTRLLSQYDPGGPWERDNSGYDRRIEYAVDLITRNQEVQRYLKRFVSICIDELQDVVGIRSRLAQEVLDASVGGFTILGDPAQGIYNYQLDGDERIRGSSVIFEWIRRKYGGALSEYTLTENHRAMTDVARSALFAGPLLNGLSPNYGNIKQRLDKVYRGLRPFTEPHQAVTLLKRTKGSTAFLCRNNGQALVISRELWRRSIDHCFQRYATDRLLPRWIGTCLSAMKVKKPGMTTVKAAIGASSSIDVDQGWITLKRIEAEPAASNLDLDVMAKRIRTGDYPDDLCDTESADIVVSTVHKAKGLQFERVIITGDDNSRFSDQGTPSQVLEAEETRTLYVALTRPERELYALPDLNKAGILRKFTETDRWFLQFGQYCVKYFEVRGEDSDSTYPAGSHLLSADALEMQNYIRENVNRGDDLVMRYKGEHCDDSGYRYHYYALEHSGRQVGLTTSRFGRYLHRTVKLKPWRTRYSMPKTIEGLRVEAVDTVAGLPGTARQAGTGVADIWLRVRASGFGTLVY